MKAQARRASGNAEPGAVVKALWAVSSLALLGLLAGCGATNDGGGAGGGPFGMGGTGAMASGGSSAVGGTTGAGAMGGTGVGGTGVGGTGVGGTGVGGTGVGGDGAGGATGGFGGSGAAGAGSGGVGAGGGATGGSGGTGVGGSGGAGGGPTTVTCNPIIDGISTVGVNGVTRTFRVQLPANTSHMALLFLWHGWLQLPSEFSNTIVYDVPAGRWVPFDPNAFPMPLMIVTPYDLKLIPPAGLDWDIVSGAQDFPFFEAMLQCIQQSFNIESTRIYSFGFSAGAVFTNLLSAKYPHLFAATISESGAWFNDMAQWSDVTIPIIQWQWPAFNPADRGNVLLTHGGPDDFATVISLESANNKAIPFLHAAGRTVVDCAHDFGHTLAPDLTQAMYYDYMWAHQLGGPPLSGLPPGFPSEAHPVGRTVCRFRPAL